MYFEQHPTDDVKRTLRPGDIYSLWMPTWLCRAHFINNILGVGFFCSIFFLCEVLGHLFLFSVQIQTFCQKIWDHCKYNLIFTPAPKDSNTKNLHSTDWKWRHTKTKRKKYSLILGVCFTLWQTKSLDTQQTNYISLWLVYEGLFFFFFFPWERQKDRE